MAGQVAAFAGWMLAVRCPRCRDSVELRVQEMARKQLFNIAQADQGRSAYEPAAQKNEAISRGAVLPPALPLAGRRRQAYREGKRAVMFFLSEEVISEMHVLLARKGRKKVQQLMEELIDVPPWVVETPDCSLRG
jgi:hypothetical protein